MQHSTSNGRTIRFDVLKTEDDDELFRDVDEERETPFVNP